jgi:uncharacterized protein (TIGR02145 family)
MFMKKIAGFVPFVFAVAFIAACGDDNSDFISRPDGKNSSSGTVIIPGSTGKLTDNRDGQTYKTVKIGTQTWMAENLNFETENSDCYKNSAEYCAKYGRLYTWAAAMDSAGIWSTNGKDCGYRNTCSPTYPVRGVCPEGWHLPSIDEWDSLLTAVGGSATAGIMLKSTEGWDESSNGTDAFGFSALPAGDGLNGVAFNSEGDYAYFWSSTEHEGDYACEVFMDNGDDYAKLSRSDRSLEQSVRCLKD